MREWIKRSEQEPPRDGGPRLMGAYETYRTQVEEAAGEWVEYGGEFKTKHSASSVANQMRHRWPDLEIQSKAGVIRARTRSQENAA